MEFWCPDLCHAHSPGVGLAQLNKWTKSRGREIAQRTIKDRRMGILHPNKNTDYRYSKTGWNIFRGKDKNTTHDKNKKQICHSHFPSGDLQRKQRRLNGVSSSLLYLGINNDIKFSEQNLTPMRTPFTQDRFFLAQMSLNHTLLIHT